ncbi:MAG: chemotaxis protein CheW [Hyphomicrobiales bacterium]|nr:chemotaxis protein CheW [Hyphomicrobiales bacterium]
MDDLLKDFLTETAENLDVVDAELVKLEQDPDDAELLGKVFRLVHTIKGTCGFIGLPRLQLLAHAGETLIGKFRDGAPVTAEAVTLILAAIDRIKAILAQLEADQREPEGSDEDLIGRLQGMAEAASKPGSPDVEPEGQPQDKPQAKADDAADKAPAGNGAPDNLKVKASGLKGKSIRVSVDALEHLMTMVSELVLTRNQLLEIARRQEENEYKVPLLRLSSVTAELQEGIMKARMQPIGNAWQKLPRIVRDLGFELDKRIELEMNGAETELDRQVLELIRDPLTHMIRNSCDHGLETTAERIVAGKPEIGRITLSAYHEGGHIIISIGDDGRGINTESIKRKILSAGLVTEAELEQMTEPQIHKFIFHPGFSTATEVTSVSGRGVGMDVVRANIELIGGSVELKSVAGQGSTFTIKIPLTLAIVSALIVEASGHRFAVPQLSVLELVRVQAKSEHRIEMIKDTPVLRLRNQLLPLVHLAKLLMLDDGERGGEGAGGRKTSEETGFIVVTQVGSQCFGIVVDGVFHTEEIVVKPMSSMLRHIAMFSGNTILGDGSVIMIIDPNGIAQAIGSNVGAKLTVAEDEAPERGDLEGLVSMLIFRAQTPEPKAVALSLITRLEEIEVDNIEPSNGRYLVQYRGGLMPLVFVDPDGKPPESGVQPLLVFTEDKRSMGLAVDEIVDIVEDRLDIEVAGDRPGVLGSAVIKGRATEVVDVGYYLPQAFADWFARKERGPAGSAIKVLLVDDSAFFRNMLTPVLKASGFLVTAVESGAAALALMDEGVSFDVIVTDIEMPEMDGFEFAEAVGADERWKDIPVIALSSYPTATLVERGREAGLCDYVAKFDREGLIVALRHSNLAMGEAA